MTAEAELSTRVEQQLRELLADPSIRQSIIGGSGFTPERRDQLESLSAQVGSMLQDRSLGAILNGPLWLSGASILNGTVNADKLVVNTLEAITTSTGTLNVTGNITAAAAFPAVAARIVINSSGLYGYQSDGVTTTFKLNVDGSGEIGTGASKASWTSVGVLSIPAASITSLTIANINTGVLGGTYTTSASTAKISLSTSGITATDSSGNTTFNMVASSGAVTIAGSFTVQSAASGARVVISNAGGMEGYNAGGTRTFFVNAATGAGQLGAGTNNISWDSSGNASIGGVALSSGKITASGLSVSTLSAITADMGTITAGSITASLITTGTLTAARISGGSLAGGYTVPSGQPITYDSGGTAGDVVVFKYSGTTKGSIYADASYVHLGYTSGAKVYVSSTTASLTSDSTGTHYIAINSGVPGVWTTEKFYPGDGTSSQATRYILADGTNLRLATAALRVDLSRTGTAQSWPTGGTATSVIMSTDGGATLLSIGAEYVTVNFNGTDRKVLCVA